VSEEAHDGRELSSGPRDGHAAWADPAAIGASYLTRCRLGRISGPHAGDPIVDEVVRCLASPGTSAIQNFLLARHLTIALGARISSLERTALHRSVPGGLSPSELELATGMLEASSPQSVAAVARSVGLSAGHFARAFKASTGHSPNRWLTLRRLEKAKQCLSASDAPLAQVALECGFNDQSYFTRVFTREAGVTPGAWRRQTAKEIDGSSC
jgi:AraC family transcriptional regulator